MNIDSALEKVRKLFAMTEEAGASPEEAASAAAIAAKLIAQYQLDVSLLNASDNEEKKVALEPIRKTSFEVKGAAQRLATWKSALANTISRSFSVRVFTAGPRIVTVGRAMNVEAFKATFNYLVDQIERMATACKPAHVHGRSWTPAFALGVNRTISERLAEESRQIEAANPQMAIVLRTEAQAVNAWVDKNMRVGTRSSSRRSISNYDGYSAGMAAGHSLNLGSVPGRQYNNAKRLTA